MMTELSLANSARRALRGVLRWALIPLAMLPVVASAGPDTAAPAKSEPIFGIWENPTHSVTVRIVPCGQQLCGTIIAASNDAKEDARKAGTDTLVGTALFRNYHRTELGHWTGTLFIPDMGRTVASKLIELSPTKLRVSGCIIAGLLCRSQEWSRD